MFLDFFSWNKVVIQYCDASSFTGNFTQGTTLSYKGAKIFQSAMLEMAEKGMNYAKKALLVGESVGGVAAMLHCDEFSNSFHSFTHIKYLSDSGYFFPATTRKIGMKIIQSRYRLGNWQGKDILKSIRKRIGNKNPKVQLLAFTELGEDVNFGN
nr:pectin acetylesterase 8-like [Ipomoea batatas]